jgi:hypothetical protein
MNDLYCRLCGDGPFSGELHIALNALGDHVLDRHPEEWPPPKYDCDMTEFGSPANE